MLTAGTTTKPAMLLAAAGEWCALGLTSAKRAAKGYAGHISDRDQASFVNTQPEEAT